MGFLSGTVVKNLNAMQETWVQPLGQEDPLEKEVTHSVFLPRGESIGRDAWRATFHGITESDMT